MSIKHHIERNKKIMDDPMISAQTRRHIEDELVLLEKYYQRHPNNDYDPSPLELYCDENPYALECRVFDV